MDGAVIYSAIPDAAVTQLHAQQQPHSQPFPGPNSLATRRAALVVASALLLAVLSVVAVSRIGTKRASRPLPWPPALLQQHKREQLVRASEALPCARDQHFPVCCVSKAIGLYSASNPCFCGSDSLLFPASCDGSPFGRCDCRIRHHFVCCKSPNWGLLSAFSPCSCECVGGIVEHDGLCK